MRWRPASPPACLLQENRLGSELDSEAHLDVGLNRRHRAPDIGARCAAVIDQHQRLFFIHADRAEAFAFPARLFN